MSKLSKMNRLKQRKRLDARKLSRPQNEVHGSRKNDYDRSQCTVGCDCEFCRILGDEVLLNDLLAESQVTFLDEDAYAVIYRDKDNAVLRYVLNESYRGFIYQSPRWTEMVQQFGKAKARDMVQSLELEIRLIDRN